MRAIMRQVPQIIEKIARRSDESERDKGTAGKLPGVQIARLTAKDHRQEDERVFCPLMEAQPLEQRCCARRGLEDGHWTAEEGDLADDIRLSLNDKDAIRRAPDSKIGVAVASILEALRKEFAQSLGFGFALEVCLAVGGNHPIDKWEALRHAARHDFI